jgi:hypothetical protein
MFLIGMLVGMAVLALVGFIRYKRIDVRWYELIIGLAGFGLLLFTVQNALAASQEYWETTPFVFLWVFGTPSLLLLAVSVLLPWLRIRRSKSAQN